MKKSQFNRTNQVPTGVSAPDVAAQPLLNLDSALAAKNPDLKSTVIKFIELYARSMSSIMEDEKLDEDLKNQARSISSMLPFLDRNVEDQKLLSEAFTALLPAPIKTEAQGNERVANILKAENITGVLKNIISTYSNADQDKAENELYGAMHNLSADLKQKVEEFITQYAERVQGVQGAIPIQLDQSLIKLANEINYLITRAPTPDEVAKNQKLLSEAFIQMSPDIFQSVFFDARAGIVQNQVNGGNTRNIFDVIVKNSPSGNIQEILKHDKLELENKQKESKGLDAPLLDAKKHPIDNRAQIRDLKSKKDRLESDIRIIEEKIKKLEVDLKAKAPAIADEEANLIDKLNADQFLNYPEDIKSALFGAKTVESKDGGAKTSSESVIAEHGQVELKDVTEAPANPSDLRASVETDELLLKKILGDETKSEEDVAAETLVSDSIKETNNILSETNEMQKSAHKAALTELDALLDQATSAAKDVDTELSSTEATQLDELLNKEFEGSADAANQTVETPSIEELLGEQNLTEAEVADAKATTIEKETARQRNPSRQVVTDKVEEAKLASEPTPPPVPQVATAARASAAEAASPAAPPIPKDKEEASVTEYAGGAASEAANEINSLRSQLSDITANIENDTFTPDQSLNAVSEMEAIQDRIDTLEEKAAAEAEMAPTATQISKGMEEVIESKDSQVGPVAARAAEEAKAPEPPGAVAPSGLTPPPSLETPTERIPVSPTMKMMADAKEQNRQVLQGSGGIQQFAEFRNLEKAHRQSLEGEAKAFFSEKFPNRQIPGEIGDKKPLGLFDNIKYGYNIAKMNLSPAKFRVFNDVSVPEMTRTLDQQKLQSSTFLGYIRNLPNMVRNGFSTFAVTVGMGAGAVVSGFSGKNKEAENARNQVEAKMDASLHELSLIADGLDQPSSAFTKETIEVFDQILKGAFEKIQQDRATLVSNEGLGSLNEKYGKNAPEVVIEAVNAVGADLGRPEISGLLTKKIADARNISIEPTIQKMDAKATAMEQASPRGTMQAGQQESIASDKIQKLRAEISELEKQLPNRDDMDRVNLQWQIDVRQTEINQLQATATPPAATPEPAVVKGDGVTSPPPPLPAAARNAEVSVTAKGSNKLWSIETATGSAQKGERGPGLDALMRITKTLHDFDPNVMQVSLLVVPGRIAVSNNITKGILRDDLSILMTSPEYTDLSSDLKLKIQRLSNACEQAEKSAKTNGKDKAFVGLSQEIAAAKKPNGLLTALNDEIKTAVEQASKLAAASAPSTLEPVTAKVAPPAPPTASPAAANTAVAPPPPPPARPEGQLAANKGHQIPADLPPPPPPARPEGQLAANKGHEIPADLPPPPPPARPEGQLAAKKAHEIPADLPPPPGLKSGVSVAAEVPTAPPVSEEKKDQIKLKVDKGEQLTSVTEKLGEAGITPIQTDWPMKHEHATISFNCTEEKAEQVVGKLAEVEPPLKSERIIKADDGFRQSFKHAAQAQSEAKDPEAHSEETIQPKSPGGSSHEQ
jgi:hypothetical protein